MYFPVDFGELRFLVFPEKQDCHFVVKHVTSHEQETSDRPVLKWGLGGCVKKKKKKRFDAQDTLVRVASLVRVVSVQPSLHTTPPVV